MVGSKELTDRVVERCRSAENDFKLKPTLVEFIQDSDNINEAEALSTADSLYEEVYDRLKTRRDRRDRRGEPLEYELVHDYIRPKSTADLERVRQLLDAFGDDEGWDSSDQRHRAFEVLVGGLLVSLGAANVRITQYTQDGGYDVSGQFSVGTDSVPIGRLPFKAEARNKSDTVSVDGIESLGGTLEVGEAGFYVSRRETYSTEQQSRAPDSINLVTKGQIVQTARTNADFKQFLIHLAPPSPQSVATCAFNLEELDVGMIPNSG